MGKDKYEILLSALADALQNKDQTIMLQKYEIESLKIKLAAAEQSAKLSGKPQNIERR